MHPVVENGEDKNPMWGFSLNYPTTLDIHTGLDGKQTGRLLVDGCSG